ncbi:MAG: pyrimidine/purine nucleoside phosphorylase [Erysipelotrichales bacterium]
MEFKNATITKQANIYFDGKVTSRALLCEDGSKITLGIMLPGTYKFNTNEYEIMEVINGKALVKLENQEEFIEYKKGTKFEIEANSSFDIEVLETLDYQCSYLNI